MAANFKIERKNTKIVKGSLGEKTHNYIIALQKSDINGAFDAAGYKDLIVNDCEIKAKDEPSAVKSLKISSCIKGRTGYFMEETKGNLNEGKGKYELLESNEFSVKAKKFGTSPNDLKGYENIYKVSYKDKNESPSTNTTQGIKHVKTQKVRVINSISRSSTSDGIIFTNHETLEYW